MSELHELSDAALAEMVAASENILFQQRMADLSQLAPDDLMALRSAAQAILDARRPAPPPPAPETLGGWTIVAKRRSGQPLTVSTQDASGVHVVTAYIWDLLLEHESGRVEEFEQCFFGANEPNMLSWCVERIEAADAVRAQEAEHSDYEAERTARGLVRPPAEEEAENGA